MRFILFIFLLTSFSLFADDCYELRNVTVNNIKVSYSSNNGTEIQGNFVGLSPATFKVVYRNLTDNGRWQSATNSTYGSDARWYIQGLQPAKEYKVRISAPYHDRWCEVAMHHIWTYLNTTDFTLNGHSSGTVSVCGDAPITVNAAACQYEDAYGIAIWEMNQSNQRVGNELLREFQGTAPNGIDLPRFASQHQFPLIGGKRYAVKVFTKPNWKEKVVVLNMTAASISIKPLASAVPNKPKEYNRCVLRGAPTLTVDTRASSCDTRYKVTIVEMNNGQEVASTRFDKWIQPFTSLPDRLDVAALYRSQPGLGFQAGKRYKVILAVGFPWAADHFYVNFLTPRQCTASGPANAKSTARRAFK